LGQHRWARVASPRIKEPDEKMLPEVTVLSETSQSTVEFPMAQLDPKRALPINSERAEKAVKQA
jgi:hypothetical protein